MKSNKIMNGAKIEILIVEDSPTQTAELQYILETNNYHVSAANNGVQALKLLKKSKPALIISDIVMPEMDGFELCKNVKADEILKDIPVILMSMLSEPKDIIRGLESGADNFVTKPYKEDYLISRIQNILINRDMRKTAVSSLGVELFISGEKHFITSDRMQILDLLVSVYDGAVQKTIELESTNKELRKTREELNALNEQLEKKVDERARKITELNSIISAVRNVNQLIAREKDLNRLLKSSCECFREICGFNHAWIALIDEQGKFVSNVETGLGKKFLPVVQRLKHGELPVCARRALAQPDIVIIEDTSTCSDCPLAESRSDMGSLSIRLEKDEKVYGILTVSTTIDVTRNKDVQNMFPEVAGDLAFALYSMGIEEKRKQAEKALQKRTQDLNERVKELNCLFSISKLVEQKDILLEDIFKGVVNIIPSSWQYPEITCAKIIIEKQEYKTKNFRETKWNLSSDIIVKDNKIGIMEVCYLEEKPDSDEGPFLKEERNLINTITERLGKIIERKKADETLSESEEKYRSLVEYAPNIILTLDIESIILSINHVIPGLNKEEVIGRSHYDFIDPEYHSLVRETIKEVIKTGKPNKYQIMGTDPDGKKSCYYTHIGVIKKNERIVGLTLITTDITDSVQAEEKLKESEERYRTLFEKAAEGIVIADMETRKFSYANPAICTMLGYSEKELLQMGVSDIHPKEALENVIAEFEAQARGEKVLAQLPCLRKDGKIIYANITATYGVIDGRECNIGFFTDISKLMESEEERIRLVTAIEQIDEYIIITDKEGTIQYVNPAFEKITGYTRDEAIGNNPRMLKSGKHGEAFYKTLWDNLLSGKTWKGHIINRKKDESIFEEETSISPIKDIAGNITNFVAVKRDVTSEVIMEQRLLESQKMEAIGTLAGGIAHDFNNILAGIIGYTELSLDTVPEGSQLHSDLTKIFKAGYRARDLVNQILIFSRQREQEKRPITIAPIVKESLKLLKASLPSTVEIHQNIESELGMVMADATQIHQVIMNLCTNAGHAMQEKGGILEVTLTNKEIDAEFCLRHLGLIPGLFTELKVSDTGNGIAADILSRIFEPYFTTKEKSGGTGLGLSVVHGIVTNSGGTVTVYSDPGKGTTFKVYLPITTEETVTEHKETPSVIKGHERILLIDDEPDILDVGKRILEQLGYTVTTNSSSMDALELFQKDPYQFDLVVSDMTMPFMTGDELAGEFMQIRQDIPIIICTGYSEKLTEEKALSIGIKAYLGKPLLKSEIAETVRRVLDEKSKDI